MHEIGKFESKVESVYKSLDRSEHGAGIADEGVEQFVGGDSVEVWPASAAWFLGPKVQCKLNLILLGKEEYFAPFFPVTLFY